MKTSFRAFGIGLFIAGMCLALLSQVDMLTAHDESAVYKKEIKALEKQLAELQNKQVSEKPGNESTLNKSAETVEETTEPSKEEAIPVGPTDQPDNGQLNLPSTPTTDIKTATIFVYEGMSLYEIGQQVEGEGIVLNGREVELYLSRPEYSRSIQKGAFDLRSDMTIEEIAKTLTGKKLD